MKVLFNTAYFAFHAQFGTEIKKEVEKRGGTFIFTPTPQITDINYGHRSRAKHIEDTCSSKYGDFDFTILPDTICKAIAGKGIYINHGIFLPQNCHYRSKHYQSGIKTNVSYLFAPSQEIADLYRKVLKIDKPIKITGFPQLDQIYHKRTNKIFNKGRPYVIYVPTGSWKSELNSERIVDKINFEKLGYKYKKLGHPANNINNDSSEDLCNADIVISDYSSIGLHAIALNIPTILVDNEYWNKHNPDQDSISVLARDASIRVVNAKQLIDGIKTYMDNPAFLEEKRKEYGGRLSKYVGYSSKIFVDELENILNSKNGDK